MNESYRYSSWLIKGDLSVTEEVWLHGYTGAIDIVEKKLLNSPDEFTIKQMMQKGYITKMSVEEEKQHFVNLIKEIEKADKGSNSYVIQFSVSCNFACTYCSENHIRKIPGYKAAKITKDYFSNIKQVINQFSESPSNDKLILFGGEPLLLENKETIGKAVDVFRDFNMSELDVITNGYNIDEYIDDFSGTGAVFQITLDGPRDVHDRRRIEKSNKKSYDKIVKNIGMLLCEGFQVNVRVNIDHKNMEVIPILFQHFVELGFDKEKNFSPYLAYILNYGKNETRTTAREMYEYFIQFKEIERFKIGRDPFGIEKTLSSSIQEDTPFEFKANYCGANKGNMLMFAPDGAMHAFWDASPVDKEINRYYPDISWNDLFYHSEWVSRTIRNIPECRECKYALFCGGGCQYLARKESGSYFSPYCNGFQDVFDSVLVSVAGS